MIYVQTINLQSIDDKNILSYFYSLPAHIQLHIEKYKHTKDRINSTLGIYLVDYFIRKEGLSCSLDDLILEKNKKPYFLTSCKNLDFNISHSQDIIVAAFSFESKVGIDIEKRRCLNLAGMIGRFSADEQRCIIHAEDSEKLFFEFWTQKEAVIKAAGIGIALPLSAVNIYNNECILGNKKWFLHQINQYFEHSCCVASSQQIFTENLIFESINFECY